MKFESAEPDSEMHGNDRIDNDVDSTDSLDLTDDGTVRNYPDTNASLDIINGYSLALKSSFQELENQYNAVLSQKDGLRNSPGRARLMTLEADCRSCLSRLCISVEQLKASLTVGGVLRDSSQD